VRIALGIEYDGSRFCGWQFQENGRSVQGAVEAAISSVADHDVRVTCAGRTDAGAHAIGQVGHFDTLSERPGRAWTMGVNSCLPADIAVSWASGVSDDFHARFSAVARSYRYVILNQALRSPLLAERAWWYHRPLDADVMQTAAELLVGEHDFSAFRAAECQAHSPVREVLAVRISRDGPLVAVDITANAFLHHMVRNITGTLVHIGRGEAPPSWMAEVLEGRDRGGAGMMAPAQGLYFLHVDYRPAFVFPIPGLHTVPAGRGARPVGLD
jgi:tRNA pseudouridine38-40 synthase